MIWSSSALPLLETGDVLDIASGDGVLAELLAPHSHRYVCIDTSARVVAAASERLRRLQNVEVREGDMHALPFKDASFDLVVLMHALTYSARPAQAVAEAATAEGETIHNMPFPVTPELVVDALVAIEGIARSIRAEHGLPEPVLYEHH